MAKALVGTPVQSASGSWTITYDVSVSNPSTSLATFYDLSDTLAYGSGITVAGASITAPSGVTINPSRWNGRTDPVVVIDQPLAAGTTQVYRVMVTATVAVDAVHDCAGGGVSQQRPHQSWVARQPSKPLPALPWRRCGPQSQAVEAVLLSRTPRPAPSR